MRLSSEETADVNHGQVGSARTHPSLLLPAVVAGLAGGLLALSASISYPAVIFTGALAPYLGVGIGMALFSSAVLGAIVAAGSSYPSAIAVAQIETAVVLGAVAAAIMEPLRGAEPEVGFASLVAVIVISSLSLGILFILLGAFRLGNLIRYIPFPVIGGFLAYIAWLLARGGMTTMVGQPLTLESGLLLWQPETLLKWLPGALAAAGLMMLQLKRRHYLNVPVVLLGSVALFWMVAGLAGTSVSELEAAGYVLPTPSQEQAWSPAAQLAALGRADWGLVLQQLPQVVVVWLVAMITLLLSASSMEVASHSDIDLNNELKVTGVGNLACGLGGGLPGYHSVSSSLLSHYLGTRSRLVGLISAAMCAATLFLGGPLFAYVPKLLLGLVLLYLALDIAAELALDRWPKLLLADRGVMLLVFFCLIWFGFVEGITIGIFAGLALFAFNYARIGVVRAAGNGTSYGSNVMRPPTQLQHLAENGDAVHVIRLQGYLFFGSAYRLLEDVSGRLAASRQVPLRHLIFDFERVNGADSSTIFSFVRLIEQAEMQRFAILFAALPEEVATALRSAGLDRAGRPRLEVFRDLDHALEYAEDAVLGAAPEDLTGARHAINELERAFPDRATRQNLIAYATRVSWSTGDHVIRQGDRSDCMFFVESGQLTARLDLADGTHVRLRTILPGTVIGEVGCYLGLPRSASVVADRDSSAFRMTDRDLRRMGAEDAELAAAFHEFMARTTAERLAYNTRLLEARSL